MMKRFNQFISEDLDAVADATKERANLEIRAIEETANELGLEVELSEIITATISTSVIDIYFTNSPYFLKVMEITNFNKTKRWEYGIVEEAYSSFLYKSKYGENRTDILKKIIDLINNPKKGYRVEETFVPKNVEDRKNTELGQKFEKERVKMQRIRDSLKVGQMFKVINNVNKIFNGDIQGSGHKMKFEPGEILQVLNLFSVEDEMLSARDVNGLDKNERIFFDIIDFYNNTEPYVSSEFLRKQYSLKNETFTPRKVDDRSKTEIGQKVEQEKLELAELVDKVEQQIRTQNFYIVPPEGVEHFFSGILEAGIILEAKNIVKEYNPGLQHTNYYVRVRIIDCPKPAKWILGAIFKIDLHEFLKCKVVKWKETKWVETYETFTPRKVDDRSKTEQGLKIEQEKREEQQRREHLLSKIKKGDLYKVHSRIYADFQDPEKNGGAEWQMVSSGVTLQILDVYDNTIVVYDIDDDKTNMLLSIDDLLDNTEKYRTNETFAPRKIDDRTKTELGQKYEQERKELFEMDGGIPKKVVQLAKYLHGKVSKITSKKTKVWYIIDTFTDYQIWYSLSMDTMGFLGFKIGDDSADDVYVGSSVEEAIDAIKSSWERKHSNPW